MVSGSDIDFLMSCVILLGFWADKFTCPQCPLDKQPMHPTETPRAVRAAFIGKGDGSGQSTKAATQQLLMPRRFQVRLPPLQYRARRPL
jgi:hypothetical protein